MNTISGLQYIGRSGLRVEVGHRFDDPYLGSPKSNLGQAVNQEGPVGIAWSFNGTKVEKNFGSRVQAVADTRSSRIVVIGHWSSAIDGRPPPNNGFVFSGDGKMIRIIEAPSEIMGKRSPSGHCLRPEGLSVIKNVDDEIEIWLSYWQGDWHEQRIYDPETGLWGRVTGQYRAV